MQKISGEIENLGGEVLVVSFAQPKTLAAHLAIAPQPFPVVADPERTAYAAFALGKTQMLSFFRPDVIWYFLRLIFRGWLPKKPREDGDVWQLGGDFVIDRAGRLVHAHPSADAADRPGNADLLQALKTCAH